MLRGEFVIPNRHHPSRGKTKGTRLTPYYSKKNKLPSLAYFTTTIQLISKKSHKE